MKALILAAGTGSRLRPLTDDIPKCLIEVQGKSLLAHQMALLASCGIAKVEIVVGHKGERIRDAVGDRATCVEYRGYASTNNLHTLHFARHLLEGELLILFSDVLLGRSTLTRLTRCRHDVALLVDTSRVLEGTMRVKLRDCAIADVGGHIPTAEGDGNFVGIAKCSAAGARLLRTELEAMVAEGGHEGSYYTIALARLAAAGHAIHPVAVEGEPWIEIDSPPELGQAETADFYLV